MNKKMLTAAVLLSVMTTGVFAADTTVDKKMEKFQHDAIVMAQQSMAEKIVTDSTLPSSVSLDVNRAVQLALENNRDVKQATSNYEKAKANVSLFGAKKNPTISYGYSASRRGTEGIAGVGSSTDSTFSNNFSLNVPIYTGGAAEANLAAARYARESAGAHVTEVQQATKLSAATDYYALIMNRNKVNIAQQAVTDYEGHLKNVNQQYQVGLVAKSDVLASNTNLANAKTSLVQAKNAANIAEASLNNVMGMPVYTKIETTDSEMTYKPYGLTLNEANAYAILHRNELIQSFLAVKQAEEGVEAAKAGYRPTVAASAGRSYSDSKWTGWDNKGWSIGASVSFNLWDGGETQNQIKMAKASLDAAKEANYKTMEAVMLDVRTAYLNMKAAEETISSTRVAVEEGQENFRIASLRYRAGVGINLDVLDAETKLESARNNYVDALYNYNTSISALEKAMGVPVVTPVAQGDVVVSKSDAVKTLDSLVAEKGRVQNNVN